MIVVHDGRVDHDAMRKAADDQAVTNSESSLRVQGCGCRRPEEVRFAVLENNGRITVIRMHARRLNEAAWAASRNLRDTNER